MHPVNAIPGEDLVGTLTAEQHCRRGSGSLADEQVAIAAGSATGSSRCQTTSWQQVDDVRSHLDALKLCAVGGGSKSGEAGIVGRLLQRRSSARKAIV